MQLARIALPHATVKVESLIFLDKVFFCKSISLWSIKLERLNAKTDKIKNDFIISTVDGALKISDISLYGDNHGVDTLIGMENLYFADGNISVASPIIMDMNGDGVHLIDKTLSSAFFDFDVLTFNFFTSIPL